MTQTRDQLPFDELPYVATVSAVLGDEVVLTKAGDLQATAAASLARLALPLGQPVEPGDAVVVLQAGGERLVIASLARRPAALQLADGSRAHIADAGGTLELHGPEGTLRWRFTTGPQGSQLSLSADRVSIAALGGDLTLSAAGDVNVRGRRVELRGGDDGDAALTLSAAGAELRARRLALEADEARHHATRTHVRSAELRAEVGDARVKLNRLEIVAQHVVQRARTLYQRVEELAQQRAGSLRVLVDHALQVRAERALTRTEGPFKVRAETIHLG
ncbi:MAG: DUF3540 domain-containing protein [Polyangiales bacterium]